MRDSRQSLSLSADGVVFRLRAPHDFAFLREFGRVFRVFDNLISGNVCFGVLGPDGAKIFVKYAGAPALRFAGDPACAARKLMDDAFLYGRLDHPALPRLLCAREAGEGFLCAFPWIDGLALAPVGEHFVRMRALGLLGRLSMFDRLASLFARAEEMGYVSACLDDSNLIVDFERPEVWLCSVSGFFSQPRLNAKGRLPGNSWYLSPEAYAAGSYLDETSSAYTTGALAFTFFGDRTGHSRSGWDAPRPLLEIAARALAADRGKRPQSVGAFLAAWRAAVIASPLG